MKLKCPECQLELDSNGQLAWCGNGHVYSLESDEYPCDDDDWDELEDGDEGGVEPLMCMYCSSPAHEGQYTCGRACCVEREIVAQVERGLRLVGGQPK